MFPYSECYELLLTELVNAIKQNKVRIEELANSEGVNIDGVSYDILPWHQFICLSFRIREDEEDQGYRYSPADWKYYEFIGDGSFQEAREFTSKLYDNPPDGLKPKDVSHLIYMVAAEVLLDPSVAALLQSCGINAPTVTNQAMVGCFEYMSLDEDQVFKANYCEIIIATRLNNFLLD